jgi:hypothetical protein
VHISRIQENLAFSLRQELTVWVGIGKTFFMKTIEKSLTSVKKHMKEEAENLKRILES